MLVQRLLVSIFLIPIGAAIVWVGGPVYGAFLGLILGLAAWEYVQLFRSGGYQPVAILVVGGTLAILAGRFLSGFAYDGWVISLVILAGMSIHLFAYERGRDQAGTDFAVSIAGVVYVGWLGSYLLLVRELTGGLWWVMLTLSSVWLADSSAFMIGRRYGRRQFTTRLSPNKTWEGYLAGVMIATIGTGLFATLWKIGAGPESMITGWRGAMLGLILGALAPLGDLGVSMMKRQVGLKDSGRLLPGHGGILDRLDSWLWAGVIGYYTILWVFF